MTNEEKNESTSLSNSPRRAKRTALYESLHDSPFYHFNDSSMKTQKTGEH
jgi:hypothetical protein